MPSSSRRASLRPGRLTGPRAAIAILAMIVALTAVVAAIVATGHAKGRVRASAAQVVPRSYVALGDSYTSGPDIPTQLGPSTVPTAPTICQRSSANYPTLTARALGLNLTDVSCGGATTADLTGSQAHGVPAQLQALRPSTSLVTVGIGGNNLGFSTIAENCAALTPWGPTRVGLTCRAHYTSGGVDRLAVAARGVGSKVSVVLADIRRRAPHARVLVIGYPDIVPAAGSGCWPLLPFNVHDLGYLRSVEADLNQALRTAAGRAGDRFVDMATPSAPHDACAPEADRWVEPVIHPAGSYPLHPGATGMVGMATVLDQVLRSLGVT